MSWDTEIENAPKNRRVWLASKCGKLILSRWSEKRGAWEGFATNGSPPIAWHPVPDFPEFLL